MTKYLSKIQHVIRLTDMNVVFFHKIQTAKVDPYFLQSTVNILMSTGHEYTVITI